MQRVAPAGRKTSKSASE